MHFCKNRNFYRTLSRIIGCKKHIFCMKIDITVARAFVDWNIKMTDAFVIGHMLGNDSQLRNMRVLVFY